MQTGGHEWTDPGLPTVRAPIGRPWARDAGERDAEFTGFFRAHYPGLVATLSVVLRDREHARDVAQEAFIQLFARWRRVSHYDRPEAWVRRVGIRMAVRAARRERLRPQLELNLDHSTMPQPIDVDVVRAVRKLSPTQRAAVALFYLEDRSVNEVAEILGCAQVTAKVHLHRARRRLAEMLLDTDGPEEDHGVA